MTQDQVRQILEKVLKISTADDTVASFYDERNSATRYANNTITQNQAKNQILLSVLTAFGNRVGRSWTNETSEDAIIRMVRRAETIARLVPSDSEYMPSLKQQKYPEINSYFKATADFSPEQRAEGIQKILKLSEKNRLTVAGLFNNGQKTLAIANSRGLFAYHKWTSSRFGCTAMTANSSGWAESINEDIRTVNPMEVFAIAREKAQLSANPKEIPPGKYTVILEPAAVAEMLTFLFWLASDAKATDEGRTFMSGKKGKKIVNKDIVLRSQPGHSQIPGLPFQYDGLVSPKTIWIKNGTVKNLFYSRFWAKKKGVTPTGFPSNLIMDEGRVTLEQMIKSIDKGILITRFWYIRTVDPMTLLLTGMTRDGAFWIEKGKIQYGIKNLRFNESPIRMLNNIELIGAAKRTGEYFDMLLPAIKVKDFNFTSTTKF